MRYVITCTTASSTARGCAIGAPHGIAGSGSHCARPPLARRASRRVVGPHRVRAIEREVRTRARPLRPARRARPPPSGRARDRRRRACEARGRAWPARSAPTHARARSCAGPGRRAAAPNSQSSAVAALARDQAESCRSRASGSLPRNAITRAVAERARARSTSTCPPRSSRGRGPRGRRARRRVTPGSASHVVDRAEPIDRALERRVEPSVRPGRHCLRPSRSISGRTAGSS